MGMTWNGSLDLQNGLEYMAARVKDSAVERILEDAAQPILEQMRQNASTDPKRVTGALLASISAKVPKSKTPKVTIGVHREDAASSDVADYAYPVEYGHGGPHPAPPHPYVRPAFDAKADEAYSILREGLKNALK